MVVYVLYLVEEKYTTVVRLKKETTCLIEERGEPKRIEARSSYVPA